MDASTYFLGNRKESFWSLLYITGLGLLFLAGFGGNSKPILAQSSTGPTNISIGTTVQTPKVKRLGINMSGQTYYDSGLMMRNLTYANSGFEGETWQSVLKCKVASGTTCADADNYAQWPANFMKGATFTFIYGSVKGATGTVVSSTTNNYSGGLGPTYNFGTVSPAPGDVFILRQASVPVQTADAGWWPAVSGGATITGETTDISPNSLGKQAIWLNAMTGSATEDSNFDTYYNRSFVQMNGSYTVYFRAKSVGGSKTMNVSVQRIATSHGNVDYLQQHVTLTNSWQDYSYTFTANEDGTYIGPVQVSFNISNGSMYLDDAYLEESAEANNPTAYRNAVVDRLRTLNPGVIRYMDNGADFGSSIDNMLVPEGERVRTGYGEGGTVSTGVPIGLEDFLVLCQTVGAEPWYTMPAGMSPTEMANLVEFLNGSPSTTYGAKRAAYGQTAPWTSVFPSIHLELGNETWNMQAFSGEAYGDPYSYGDRVGTIFAAARASASYSPVLDLVADGWAVLPWWNSNVMTASKGTYDTLDAAPYTFNSLTDYSSSEAIFGPMFAQPEGVDSFPSGYMYQQMQTAATAAKPAKLAVYEVNLSTVQGTAPQATVDAVVPSVAAGISTAEHMLLMMRDDGIVTQNMFALPEYTNGFSNSKGGNESVKLWGSVVDMGGQSNLCRPTFLAAQLANTGIFGNLMATVQTGNNPTWTSVSTNDNINVVGAHYIQSIAFQNGNQHSVIVFNLSRTKALPVTFSGANAPSGTVQVGLLTSSNLTDTNEAQSVVSINNSSISNFNAATGVTLPPFSMTVYTWGATGSQPPPASNTTTTLTASPSTVTAGQTVTLAATVAPASGSTPTGNVTFYDSGSSLGTTALANGNVMLSVSSLAVGSHSITASYAGTSTDNASTSAPVTVTVNASTPVTAATTTTLHAPASVTQGSSATFTATITPASGSTPTGTVNFMVGSSVYGSATLNNGTATLTSAVSLAPGQYSMVASYLGTSTDKPSTSSPSTVTVTQAVSSTTTTLSAPSTRLTDGKTASVTATVTAAAGAVPTGSVSFYVSNTLIATQALSGGKTTYTVVVSMPAGNYSVIAKYAGDSIDQSSTSAPLPFTVVNDTAVNLTSGSTSVAEGSPVALTASVVPQTGNVTATGAVTFYLGQTALSSQQLTNGVAAASDPINLPPGQYELTAVYAGDDDDNGSTSNDVALTVTAASVPAVSTNTTITSSATQVTQGQSIQLAAFVKAASGSTPTGTVSFYLGQTQLGSATLVAGSATASENITMAAGTYQLTAVYAGTSQDSASSSAPIAITIAPSVVATTTTLISSASQLIQGQTFSLSAAVSTTNGSTPQGNVTFYLGQTSIAVTTLSGGQAAWSGLASFAPGTYQLTAVYAGNSTDTTSTSSPISISVSAVVPPVLPVGTSTLLSLNPAQVTVGQNLTFSSQVVEIGGSAIPTGTVAFYLGQTQVGSAILAGGQASFTTPVSFAPGVYQVTAIYSGDASDVASTSSAAQLTVSAATVPINPVPTSTSLSVNPAQVTAGQNLTFTSQVAEVGGSANPTGTVAFYLGQTQVGSGILAGGQASFTTPVSFAPGVYQVTAVYSGDAADVASTSSPITLTVNAGAVVPPSQYNTSISLTANPQTVTSGQNMTLAVQVQEQGGSAIPSGSVSFYLGQTLVGNTLLSNGTASMTMLAPAAGTYTLNATYAGSGEDLASQSQPITITVNAAGNTQPIIPVPPAGTFTLGLSDTKVSLDSNQTASLQVLLSAVQGYQGTVQLSCSGLPAGVTCNFSPAQVSIVSATANSMLSLSSSTSTRSSNPMMTNVTYAVQLPWGITSLFALFARKKRSKYRFGTLALLLLAVSGGLVAMTGCGLTVNSITQPYQVSVTAVGANQQSQTQSFTLYVTGPAAQF